jgi:hypothetical protein
MTIHVAGLGEVRDLPARIQNLPARISDLMSPIETKQGYLQRAVLGIHRAHQQYPDGIPTNGRFIFYEGLQAGYWPKHYNEKEGQPRRRTPNQDVTDALMYLREVGLIDWEDIRDETRILREWAYASTVTQYLLNELPFARINVWGDELPPLVLCESRSLTGVLEVLLSQYLTPVGATGGQVGGFLRTNVAPILRNDRRVLYLGDWDWQGGQIEHNTRTVLEEITGRTFVDDMSWRRLALTEAQVDAYDLERKNKVDNRYNDKTPREAVESESLQQHMLVGIVRAELDALLPEPLDAVLVQEEGQRRQAGRALQRRNGARRP